MANFNRVMTIGETSVCTFNAQIQNGDFFKVTFPKAFKSTPDITCSVDSGHNGDSVSALIIDDRTATDCTVLSEFKNFPVTLNFILVGELAMTETLERERERE